MRGYAVVVAAGLLAQGGPAAGPPTIDRGQIVIRDGSEGRPETEVNRPPPAPEFPAPARFWNPTRLAIGVGAVIVAGLASAVAARRPGR